MLTTTSAYKAAIAASSRTTRITGTLTLADNTEIAITNADIVDGSLYLKEQCVSGENIDIGNVYASEMGLGFITPTADPYAFDGAILELSFGLLTGYTEDEVPAEIWEDVLLGVFYVSDPIRRSYFTELTAYDSNVLLAIPKGATLATGTPFHLIDSACTTAGVTMAQSEATINALPNGAMTLVVPANGSILTCRDQIMWVCQVLSCFGRFSRAGALEIVPMHSASVRTIPAAQRYTPLTVSDAAVKVTQVTMQILDTMYTSGTLGMTLALVSNPLFESQTGAAIQAAIDAIQADITQAEYSPVDCPYIGDPSLQAGDYITLSETQSLLPADPVGLLTHSEWHYRGRHQLRSVGQLVQGLTQVDQAISALRKDAMFGTVAAYRVNIGPTSSFDTGYDPTDIKIGGRNLLQKTGGDMTITAPWSSYGNHSLIAASDYLRIVASGAGGGGDCITNTVIGGIVNGQEYMISFDMNYENGNGGLFCALSGGVDAFNIQCIGGWQHVVHKLTGSSDLQSLYIWQIGAGEIRIKNIKLEEGNRATGWTPAPEDVGELIASAQGTIDELAPAGLIEASKLGTTVIDGGYLQTILIKASQIYGDALTLGGDANANGTFVLKNAAEETVGTIDKDGINMTADIRGGKRFILPLPLPANISEYTANRLGQMGIQFTNLANIDALHEPEAYIGVQDITPLIGGENVRMNIKADKIDLEGLVTISGVSIALLAYPVGSIYMSVVSTSPATLFGGTWIQTSGGRMLVGQYSADTDFDTAGDIGGEQTHALIIDEIPAHNHDAISSPLGQTLASAYETATAGNAGVSLNTGNSAYPYSTDLVGGGLPHNNMPPYLVVYMWKRTA